MKKILFSLLCLVGMIGQAEAMHTGRVFVDKNRNGFYDGGEQLLENVLVSDGRNVVKTGKDGSFRLPGHEREKFIFITTPSGYKSDNKHYIPITTGRVSFDFGLQAYKEGINSDGSHRFIQLSDTEIFNTTDHDDWVSNVRDYARNEDAAFIIHTGDICYEKGLREHIGLMNTANMGRPMFYCIGNHDLIEGNSGEALFEEIYGPVYYSFEVGNTHYIVTPMPSGDYPPSYTKEDVYLWLKNDLRQVPLNKPVIVLSHDLLSNDEQFLFGISDTEVINLNNHNLKAWVYGHWHINYMKKQGNVTTICTGPLDKGGIDHSANAFRVIDVSRTGNVSGQLRYTYLDKHIEIASPGADGFPLFVSGAVPLTVNTYHATSPTKEVVYTCLVDGKKMHSNKKMSQRTDWTWKDIIYLNQQHKGKRVSIHVTATFRNGEKAEKEITFTNNNRKPLVNLTENWSNLRNDAAHTGANKATFLPPLQMAWTNNIGATIFMTSPVIHKGMVFVASVDENLKGEGFLYALNGQTGDIKWKYPMLSSVKNSIAVDDDLVFAQTVQGSLIALNVSDGSLKWGKQLHVNGLPALINGLIVSNGVVYAGTGQGLCALDMRTGDRIWESNAWQQGEGTTSTLTLGEGTLIASAQWRGLYGHDPQTGALKWSLDKNGISDRGASAAIYNGFIYIISAKSLFIIDPDNGNVIVRKEYPFNINVTSTPLMTDQELIFGSADNGLIAVDKETLEIKWQYQTEDALIYTSPYTRKVSATIETSPVLVGSTVYVGASDGTLYGIDKEKGELVWKHATGAPILGSIAVAGNTLVAVDFGGNVYAFTGGGE